jgi:hypothetical protein
MIIVLITMITLQVSTNDSMQDYGAGLLPSGQVISQRSFPPRTGERRLGEWECLLAGAGDSERLRGEYLRCGEREPRRLSRGERDRRDRSGVSARRRMTGERPRYRPLSDQRY